MDEFSLDEKIEWLTAARKDDVDIIRDFVSKGFDINYTNDTGRFFDDETALSVSVRFNSNKVLDYLLGEGADVMAGGKTTPLHWACSSNKHDIHYVSVNQLQKLVEHGADIEARNKIGTTPICWLVRGGLDNIVEFRFMLEQGARLDVVNAEGHDIFKFNTTKKFWCDPLVQEDIILFAPYFIPDIEERFGIKPSLKKRYADIIFTEVQSRNLGF